MVSYFTTSTPVALAQFQQPAQSMLISEKGAGGGNQYILTGTYYAMWAAHFDGGNIAFVDGHVKLLKYSSEYLPSPWVACYAYASKDYCMHPPIWTISNVF